MYCFQHLSVVARLNQWQADAVKISVEIVCELNSMDNRYFQCITFHASFCLALFFPRFFLFCFILLLVCYACAFFGRFSVRSVRFVHHLVYGVNICEGKKMLNWIEPQV